MSKYQAYSARVALSVIVGGVTLVLSHLSSDYLVVRNCDTQFESSEAMLIVDVDGKITKRSILLPHGIPRGTFLKVDYF